MIVVAAARRTHSVVLTGSRRSVAVARQLTRDLARQWDFHDSDAATICVTEVVTNAVEFAGTDVRIEYALDEAGLSVAVTDGAHTLPKPVQADPMASRGRGLAIVEAMAKAWGVDELPHGKTVWFTLAT